MWNFSTKKAELKSHDNLTMTTSISEITRIVKEIKDTMLQQESTLKGNRKILDDAGKNAPLPEGIKIEKASINDKVDGEWLSPKQHDNRVLLFLHGGGYSVGSTLSHRPLCSRLADAAAIKILVINYRLAPEHKYPAALEDSLASYLWLLNQGYSPQQIFFAGDSAGGGLMLSCLLLLKEKSLPQPAGAIGISVWLDLECSSASYQKNEAIDLMASAEGLRFVGRGYANKNICTNPLVSPFYAEDLGDLCPLLLQVGSAETLLDEVTAVAKKAKENNVNVTLEIWPNMVHVWHSLSGLIPEAEQAIDAIANWINKAN